MAGFLTATWKGNLFPEGFFHLADFLLHFPGYLFSHTFAFQVGIVRQLAHLFLNLAFHFVGVPAISFSVLGFILSPPLKRFEFRHSDKRPSASPTPESACCEHLAVREHA